MPLALAKFFSLIQDSRLTMNDPVCDGCGLVISRPEYLHKKGLACYKIWYSILLDALNSMFNVADIGDYAGLPHSAPVALNDKNFPTLSDLNAKLANAIRKIKDMNVGNQSYRATIANLNTVSPQDNTYFRQVINFQELYQQAYDEGRKDGLAEGEQQAYQAAYQAGRQQGNREGFEAGRQQGYEEGKSTASQATYQRESSKETP